MKEAIILAQYYWAHEYRKWDTWTLWNRQKL